MITDSYKEYLPVHVCTLHGAYMYTASCGTFNVSTYESLPPHPPITRERERERERHLISCNLFHYLIGSIAVRHSSNKVSHTYYPLASRLMRPACLHTGTIWSPAVTNGPTV